MRPLVEKDCAPLTIWLHYFVQLRQNVHFYATVTRVRKFLAIIVPN